MKLSGAGCAATVEAPAFFLGLGCCWSGVDAFAVDVNADDDGMTR